VLMFQEGAGVRQ